MLFILDVAGNIISCNITAITFIVITFMNIILFLAAVANNILFVAVLFHRESSFLFH